MEKFRKFADHATGINPFLNPGHIGNKPLLQRLQILLLRTGLFFIKFPLFLVFVITTIFASILVSLVPVPSVKRYLTILSNHFTYRVLLWLLGVHQIEGIQRKPPHMRSGDLLLAINSSPLDLYLLKYLASPVFLEITIDAENNKTLARITSLNILNILTEPLALAFSETSQTQINQGKPLQSILTEAKNQLLGPVVLFFEGSRTNGTGLLQIEKALFDELKSFNLSNEITVYSSEFQTNSFDVSPICVPSSGIWKSLELLSCYSSKAKVRLSILEKGENLENKLKTFYVSAKRPQLKVGWKDFRDFMDFYRKTLKKDYAKEKGN